MKQLQDLWETSDIISWFIYLLPCKWADLLNDDSLDDRTNKMEGPISNLMHTIENKFSGRIKLVLMLTANCSEILYNLAARTIH